MSRGHGAWSRWQRFWLAEGEADVLATNRVLFFGFLFAHTLFFDRGVLPLWGSLPEELWLPVGPLRVFDSPPLGETGLRWVERLWVVSLLFSAVGLFTRVAMTAAAASIFVLTGMSLSYGETSYDNVPIVVYCMVLAASRAGDRLSVDAFFRGPSVHAPHWEYHWPIRLMQAVCVAMFFGAGISKLKNAGLSWVFSDTLANYFLLAHYRSMLDPFTRELGLGLWLAESPLLCRMGAAAILSLEVLSPLAFLSRRLRPLVGPALFASVIGFVLTCTDGFFNLFALFFCWAPAGWHRVIARGLGRTATEAGTGPR